jgi:RNA polymerase primary sigma factor
VHILDLYHKYLKFIEKELKNKGTYPEKDYIARKLKIDTMKLNEILNIIKAPKSLDLEYENEESDSGRTLKDTIEDTGAEKSDEVFFEKDKKEKMMKLVQKLKPKEQQVVIYRFGLDNDSVLTLEEIGEKLKLTRERIRQIELIAIKKLKYLMKNSDNS